MSLLGRYITPTNIIAFVILLVLGCRGFIHSSMGWNQYQLQAQAFLAGRLDVRPNLPHDYAIYNEKAYSPKPLAPAFLFIPAVALFGSRRWVPAAVCLLLTVINVLMLTQLSRCLGLQEQRVPWILAAYFLGTGYWFCFESIFEAAYASHIIASTFLLASIREGLGEKKVSLGALFLGISIATRYSTFFALPFVASTLLVGGKGRRQITLNFSVSSLILFVGILGAILSVQLLLNLARFGNPFESGYSYVHNDYPLDLAFRQQIQEYGLMSVWYVPRNLFFLLIRGFQMTPTTIDYFGTSLLAASPFVLITFFSSFRKYVFLWSSILAMVLFNACYAYPGYLQINCQRYSLDYMALLFVPIITAFASIKDARQLLFWKGTISYAIALNFLALVIHKHLKDFPIPW